MLICYCAIQRKAVSTSHCSQPNTIEYEMAVDWIYLHEKTVNSFERLYKVLYFYVYICDASTLIVNGLTVLQKFLYLFAGAAWWKEESHEGPEGQVNKSCILTNLFWTMPSIPHQGLRIVFTCHSYKDRICAFMQDLYLKLCSYLQNIAFFLLPLVHEESLSGTSFWVQNSCHFWWSMTF